MKDLKMPYPNEKGKYVDEFIKFLKVPVHITVENIRLEDQLKFVASNNDDVLYSEIYKADLNIDNLTYYTMLVRFLIHFAMYKYPDICIDRLIKPDIEAKIVYNIGTYRSIFSKYHVSIKCDMFSNLSELNKWLDDYGMTREQLISVNPAVVNANNCGFVVTYEDKMMRI